MRFRFHRGSLDESLATMASVYTLEQLEMHIAVNMPYRWTAAEDGPLQFFYQGYDDRIDWDTWYVSDRHGILGMSDGDLTKGVEHEKSPKHNR